jgi:hypothetical protein
MNELRVLVYLVVGIFKLIAWLITGVAKVIKWAYDKFVQTGLEELERRKQVAAQRAPARIQAQPLKRAPAVPPLSAPSPLVARARELATSAAALSTLAAERRATERFVPTLDALIDRAELAARTTQRSDPGAHQGLAREEALLKMVGDMVTERRDPDTLDLLVDTDALASASYAPIVEYCRNRRIPLSSDRAATIVDGAKIFFMSVDDPTGLAAIVVPDSFRREIVAWPAIAHEIAHDFYRSVAGLPAELHRALALGDNIAVPQLDGTREGLGRELAEMPARATLAWMEELFADAFGTMMVGPAYVETMAQLFATPDDPARSTVIIAEQGQRALRYEEHPPGHVRVVVACRLLGQMGYGKLADGLEARWRKRHANPDSLYVPLADGRYARVPEGPTLERAAEIADRLYLGGLPCLRGQPLRSIPGLDFGPREQVRAEQLAAQLAIGEPVRPDDARLLVAGAVLATLAAPQRAAEVYALARAAIEGLPSAWGGTATVRELGPLVDGPAAVREAFILGELLGAPACRRGLPAPGAAR